MLCASLFNSAIDRRLFARLQQRLRLCLLHLFPGLGLALLFAPAPLEAADILWQKQSRLHGVNFGHFADIHPSEDLMVMIARLNDDETGGVVLYDVAQGEITDTYNTGTFYFSVWYSTDGSQIVALDRDNAIDILNSATGELVVSLGNPAANTSVSQLALNADSGELSFIAHSELVCIDVKGPTQKARFQLAFARSKQIALSRDGSALAFVHETDDALQIVNTDDGSLIREFAVEGSSIHSIALSGDASRLAVGGLSSLTLYTVADGAKTVMNETVDDLLGFGGSINEAVVRQADEIRVLNIPAGAEVSRRRLSAFTYKQLVFPQWARPELAGDGRRMILRLTNNACQTLGRGSRALLIDLDSERPSLPVPLSHIASIRHVSFSANSSAVATYDSDSLTMIWNTADGSLAGSFEFTGPVALGPDGDILYAATEQGVVEYVIAGRLILDIHNVPGGCDAGMIYRAGGKQLVCASATGLSLLRPATGAVDRVFPLPEGDLGFFAMYNGNGSLLAVDTAGMIIAWNLDSGEELFRSSLPAVVPDRVRRITALSPDGMHLAGIESQGSSSRPGSGTIWEVQTGSELRDIGSGIADIQFSPDGDFAEFTRKTVRDFSNILVQEYLQLSTGRLLCNNVDELGILEEDRYLPQVRRSPDGRHELWWEGCGNNFRYQEACRVQAVVDVAQSDESSVAGPAISVRPNPASGPVVISCYLPQGRNANAELVIRSVTGRIVARKELGLDATGRAEFHVNLQSLAAGFYLCELQSLGLAIPAQLVLR